MNSFTHDARFERVECGIGRFLAFSDDLITDQLKEFGAHTRNELALVLAELEPGDQVVDIGAHIGTYAIPLARRVGPSGGVLAIEAEPVAYDLLVNNIGLNGLNTAIQTRRRILGRGHDGSVSRVNVDGNTGAGFFQAAGDGQSGEPVTDALACLCEAGFSRPSLIKLDVEGMELDVLQSLYPILCAHRPTLYIEISAPQLARSGVRVEQVNDYLDGLGYEFFRNVGDRNSANDQFTLVSLSTLSEGGEFFDLLARPRA